MSGERLCGVLGELGFEGHEALDPDSFDWPFHYDDLRPLLHWICSALRPANALSLSDLSLHDRFLREGKLLEGGDLDSAYDSISAFLSWRDNQEAVSGAEERLIDIREAKLAYKAEALQLQKQLARLQYQSDLLASEASLVQGRRARVAATSRVNGHRLSLDKKLSRRNWEMSGVLGKIASTVHELAHYHSGDDNGIYLIYSDFNSYVFGHSSCTKELKQWFAKQFDTGPFHLIAEEGKSKCSWVNLDDTTYFFARGDPEKHHHHYRITELQRLRSIFGTSERKWVEAQVENARQQAILATLKSQISADEARIHLDIHSLRQRHSELSGEISSLHLKERKLLSETIPCLCSEIAQLQDTYILEGDYDLEVMRQEYYISRQKTYINHLANLLARHHFLKLACSIEQKSVLGVYSFLKVIESELHGYLSAACIRMGHYLSASQIASEICEQGAVDDRDIFLHGIRDLLSIHSNGQGTGHTYISTHGIIQKISNLQSDLCSLQIELENSLPEDRRRCINDMCVLIHSLEQLLFTTSNSAERILTPRLLARELDELENVGNQLSVSKKCVKNARRAKPKKGKHHPHEVEWKRQVFVDFFCYPDRLRSKVRELAARVKAKQELSTTIRSKQPLPFSAHDINSLQGLPA